MAIKKKKTTAKGALKKKKIITDDAFEGTKENREEVGRAAAANELIRRAFQPILLNMADRYLRGRLTKITSRIILCDLVHDSGKRVVLPENLYLLSGFNFNRDTRLQETLLIQPEYFFNRQSGEVVIYIHPFVPRYSIVSSSKANYFRLYVGASLIDFDNDDAGLAQSVTGELAIDTNKVGPVNLTISLPPNSTLPLVITVGIEFYQLTRGTRPSLVDKKFNAMGIVKVIG
jgi:hypothetical protein